MVAKSRASKMQKGQRLQKWVAACILKMYPFLSDRDVSSTSRSAPGVDVRLSEEAHKSFPFSIECKNQERLGFWTSWKQTRMNTPTDSIPIMFVSKNRDEVLVTLQAEVFFKLWNSPYNTYLPEIEEEKE